MRRRRRPPPTQPHKEKKIPRHRLPHGLSPAASSGDDGGWEMWRREGLAVALGFARVAP
jgi:hypothetical protein